MLLIKTISLPIDCRDHEHLMQASFQLLVEDTKMKENSNRFKLAHSSPLLDSKCTNGLEWSEEGNATNDIL